MPASHSPERRRAAAISWNAAEALSTIMESASDLRSRLCPRQDSNLRTRLRRAVLYPLSYGGATRNSTVPAGPAQPVGAGSGSAPRSANICVITEISAVCASSILPAKLRTTGRVACSAAYCIIPAPPWWCRIISCRK